MTAALVENLADDVVRLEGDAHVWRQIALAALAQLHEAHTREQQYRRRVETLVAEVRRLRQGTRRAA